MLSDFRIYGCGNNDFCHHRSYHNQLNQLTCFFGISLRW